MSGGIDYHLCRKHYRVNRDRSVDKTLVNNQPGYALVFNADVFSGQESEFELFYGNAGGWENNAYIHSEFPPDAPFIESYPTPDDVDINGLWAEWNLGSLGTGDEGNISVIVEIAPDLPIPSTIEIFNGIFDHDNILDDETLVAFNTISNIYLPLVIRDSSP